MLNYAKLSISAKTHWSASEAKRFLDDAHSEQARMFANKFPLLPSFSRDEEMERHVTKYLTHTFKSHWDLSNKVKNAVLWSTAMFIESVLVDRCLIGGFFVSGTRFANNDEVVLVGYLRDERDKAMTLFDEARTNLFDRARTNMLIKNQSLTKSALTKPPVAFVYVVAQSLGFGGDHRPHLLMIGHTRTRTEYRHWGVPGGLRDRNDSSSLFSAMRELGEELLSMVPSKMDVVKLMQTAKNVGYVNKFFTKDDNQYTAWSLTVQSALQFETAFGLDTRRTIKEKYNAPLSKETKGYLWIPFPLRAYQRSTGGNWYVDAPDKLQKRPLLLRSGVLGPSSFY